MGQNTFIQMEGISKRYGQLLANDNIALELHEGEILGLLGENGAGKTTLMKILFGLLQPDSGEIFVNGERVKLSNPKVAAQHGIGMVHQHFSLSPALTVAENIVLGEEPRRFGFYDVTSAVRKTEELCAQVGLEVDSNSPVASLSVAEQQRVEILKALYRNVKVLILDEPTAVLAPQSIDDLFLVVQRLTDQGLSVIFITHKLKEVMSLADRVTILRKGTVVGNVTTENATESEMARLVVGHDVTAADYNATRSDYGESLLEVNNVTVEDERGISKLTDVSITIRKSEILGIAGVEGNGQAELEQIIIGLSRAKSGSVRFKGEDISQTRPRSRLESGLWFIPSDRHHQGLMLDRPLTENLILGSHWRSPNSQSFWLQPGSILKMSGELMHRFDVRAEDPTVLARQLSGGNQQKLVVARALGHDPEFLLAAQPTRGIDVAALDFVHRQLLALRKASGAILLISFDLDELLKLSDRIAVLYGGQIVAEFDRDDFDKERIGLFMVGGTETTEA